MPKPLLSNKSDDMVLIKVTPLEAHLIKIIRSVPYGKVIVETAHGAPFKVIPQSSILLKADQAGDLIVSSES